MSSIDFVKAVRSGKAQAAKSNLKELVESKLQKKKETAKKEFEHKMKQS